MAFQFPVAPTVGQVFSPAAGVSYKWNGTGWSPMAAQAAMLNPDGTVTAPGISWSNEPSAGWYRAPNVRNYAWGGIRAESLGVDPTAPGFTSLALNAPLAGGETSLYLVNAPTGVSPYRLLGLRTNSTGHRLFESLGGGATAQSLTLDFPAGVSSTGPVRVPDGTQALPGISWANKTNTGFFRAGADTGFTVSIDGTLGAVWQRNASTHPFLTLYSGTGATLNATNVRNSPLMIQSPGAGAVAGIGLINDIGFAFTINAQDAGYGINIGAEAAAGPGALDKYAMRIQHDGTTYARSFTQMTFAATNSVPMTGALSDLVKLRGVRCFNTETNLPDIRLEVDELELAFPELVSTIGTGKGINYAALAAPIVEAIRELHNRVTTLEANGIPVPR